MPGHKTHLSITPYHHHHISHIQFTPRNRLHPSTCLLLLRLHTCFVSFCSSVSLHTTHKTIFYVFRFINFFSTNICHIYILCFWLVHTKLFFQNSQIYVIYIFYVFRFINFFQQIYILCFSHPHQNPPRSNHHRFGSHQSPRNPDHPPTPSSCPTR